MGKLSIKEIITIVNKIETEFPVDKISYKGLKVWPIIRWLHTYKRKVFYKNTTNFKREKNNILDRVKENINTASKFIDNAYLHPIKSRLTDKQGHSPLGSSEVDVLAIVKNVDRNEYVDGKYFCRFIDSLFHFTKKNNSSIKTVEFTFAVPFKTPRYLPSSVVSPALATAFFKSLIISRFTIKSEEIAFLEEYLEYLNQLDKRLKINVNKQIIIGELCKVLCYKKVFQEILEATKPKTVVFSCYYTPGIFAATLACNERNIPTIEVQHGQQGDYHLMYTHWKSMPQEGYDLLPTHFWMWGEKSAARIREWANKTQRHQVILGGNPWVAFCSEYDVNITESDILAFDKLIKNKPKKVLIAMQYVEDFYNSCLIEAMREGGDDFLWLIRMHPRMLRYREEVEKFLKKNNCKNYELTYANSLPVYYLFKKVNIQITFWSTVAYEGLAFGVHTILIHRNGYDAMKAYVDENVFKYTENAQELISFIESGVFEKEKTPYILASSKLIQEEFSAILNV
ncbi:MAG: hypothetical protein AB8B69_19835 [Chitinophagales bacterium]